MSKIISIEMNNNVNIQELAEYLSKEYQFELNEDVEINNEDNSLVLEEYLDLKNQEGKYPEIEEIFKNIVLKYNDSEFTATVDEKSHLESGNMNYWINYQNRTLTIENTPWLYRLDLYNYDNYEDYEDDDGYADLSEEEFNKYKQSDFNILFYDVNNNIYEEEQYPYKTVYILNENNELIEKIK